MGSARRRWQRAGDTVVVALLAAGELEIWLSHESGSKLAAALFAVAWTSPLLLRRRFPLAAPLAAVAGSAAASFLVPNMLQTTSAPIFSGVLAGWALGRRNKRARALVGLVTGLALAQIAILHFSKVGVGDVVYASMILAVPWLAGQAVRDREGQLRELRERAVQLEREGEQRTRGAVAGERLRIARELHDVVAHSISVMTIQAGGARLLLEKEPERAEQSLRYVEETGRSTLEEMRRMPGVVSWEQADRKLGPRPSLADLSSLLEQVRSAGLPVELVVCGTAHDLPGGLDLAAYRVVQEALTNTLKHAGPATARVRVQYAPHELDLEVEDNGVGTDAGGGSGHGLAGMRERVAMYGGEVTAGRRPGGGYAVRARLPLKRDAG